jgi:hypothetical protein
MDKRNNLLAETALNHDKFEVLNYLGKFGIFPMIHGIYRKIPSDTGLLCQYLWKFYDKFTHITNFYDIIKTYLSHQNYIFLKYVKVKDLLSTFKTILIRPNIKPLMNFLKPEIFDKFGVPEGSDRMSVFLSHISISSNFDKITTIAKLNLIELLTNKYYVPSLDLQQKRLIELGQKDIELNYLHYIVENYDLNQIHYKLIETILSKLIQDGQDKEVIDLSIKMTQMVQSQLAIRLLHCTSECLNEINWLSSKGQWGFEVLQSLTNIANWNNYMIRLIFQNNESYSQINLNSIKILRKIGLDEQGLKIWLKLNLNLDVNLEVTQYLIKSDFFVTTFKDIIETPTQISIQQYIKIKHSLPLTNKEIKILIESDERNYKKILTKSTLRRMIKCGIWHDGFIMYCIETYWKELLQINLNLSEDEICYVYKLSWWKIDQHIPLIQHLLNLGYYDSVNQLIEEFYIDKIDCNNIPHIMIQHIYDERKNSKYISLWSMITESRNECIFNEIHQRMFGYKLDQIYTPNMIWDLIQNKLYHLVDFIINDMTLLEYWKKGEECYKWIEFNRSKYGRRYHDYDEYKKRISFWEIFNF